jgi:hypothetical protein
MLSFLSLVSVLLIKIHSCDDNSWLFFQIVKVALPKAINIFFHSLHCEGSPNDGEYVFDI